MDNFVIAGRLFECGAGNRGPHLVGGSDPPQPVPPSLQLLPDRGDMAGPASVPVPAQIQTLRQVEEREHGKVLNCVQCRQILEKYFFVAVIPFY